LKNTGKLEQTSSAAILEHLQTNTLGPHRVTQALLPLLSASEDGRPALILTVSSGLGSISDNTSGGYYGYRISKAAVNMWNKSLSHELRDQKIIAVVICPGWVQTDMGGSNASLTPEASTNNIINNIIEKVTLEDTGKFISQSGKELTF
jgi:short-subunit dehydrogenase